MSDDDRRARRRFLTIGLVRLAGVLVLALGIARAAGSLDHWPAGLGYAATVIGIVLMLPVPIMLARRWRSPPEA